MARTSRRFARPVVLVSTIVAFCAVFAAAQPRPDPWARVGDSTAWILLGDFSDTAMTTPFPGSAPPLITAQIPKPGEIMELKRSQPLLKRDLQEYLGRRITDAPARSAQSAGADLQPGDRVRVLEIFIDDTMQSRRRVFARVSPDRPVRDVPPDARLQPRIRWTHQTATPLPERLEAGDEVVEVTKLQVVDYLSFSGEPPDATVARLAKWASRIVLARVTSIEPVLVENGSWIDMRIRGTALEVLKSVPPMPRRSFEAFVRDGERSIGKVLVRAGTYPVLKVDRRYLLFMYEQENRLEFAGIFEVSGNDALTDPPTFKGRYENQPEALNPFDGMSLAQALRMIQKHVSGP